MAVVRELFSALQRTGKGSGLFGINTDKTAMIQCILAKKTPEFLNRSAKIMVAILTNDSEREDKDASSVFSGMGDF
jgi:hypothetical protein